jgi:hypothetical protein
MKIIFMKSTTETMYMDSYVRLCCVLFKKFNDRENAEMNFRKLLLTRCEKQFYKLLEKEQTQRRSRRQSMEEAALILHSPKKEDEAVDSTPNLLAEQMREQVPTGLGGTQSHVRTATTVDSDFNKQMLFVFDESELECRRVQQMHGNMQLIVELYKHEQISSVILNTCIEDLLQELNN